MPSSGNQTENRTEPENPLHALPGHKRRREDSHRAAPDVCSCHRTCSRNHRPAAATPTARSQWHHRVTADSQQKRRIEGHSEKQPLNSGQVNEHLQGNLLTLNPNRDPNKPVCKRYTDKTWYFIQEYHHLINKLWTQYEFVMKYFYNLELNPRMCTSNPNICFVNIWNDTKAAHLHTLMAHRAQRQAHVRKK